MGLMALTSRMNGHCHHTAPMKDANLRIGRPAPLKSFLLNPLNCRRYYGDRVSDQQQEQSMADLTSPTYRQRFSTVTPDDHGAYIYIAAFLTVTYCSGTFIARCFIKRKVFGIDDWAACIGQASTPPQGASAYHAQCISESIGGLLTVSKATFVIQFTFLVIAVSAGLGRNYKLLKEAEYSRMASVCMFRLSCTSR
jgi:hypothetical protein